MGKGVKRVKSFADENPCSYLVAAIVCFIVGFILLVVGSVFVDRYKENGTYQTNNKVVVSPS